MRKCARTVGLSLALLQVLTIGGVLCAQPAQRPNIVFVLADDLGWTDLGVYGSRFYETPSLDRLARQGMRFTDAYANAPNCAPTRAALMSGQYYPRQPVYTVSSGARGKEAFRKLVPVENETVLPAEKVTMAEVLRRAGYATGFIGKWHLGGPPAAGPRQQGFDVNVGGYETGRPSWPGGYFEPNNNPYIDAAREDEYLTDYLAREAARFIEEHRDQPFYLQLSHYAPHTPLQAPEARTAKYEQKAPVGGHGKATYAAMVESVDRSVGRVMEALEQAELTENTIVIFYSDNGGLGGYDDLGLQVRNITDNTPLKGGKGSLYEGGIRVPLVVRWPGHVPAGTVTDEPVTSIDFYPTFLKTAGIEPPVDYPLDGVSILPVLRNPQAILGREHLYWHFPGYLQASTRRGTWRTTPVSVIRSGTWKLLYFYEDDRVELYDLAADVGEKDDLAEERPAMRRALHQQLRQWFDAMDAPRPTPKEQ